MSTCNHSNDIVCLNCPESEIMAMPFKPMKGSFGCAAYELSVALHQFLDDLIGEVENLIHKIREWANE